MMTTTYLSFDLAENAEKFVGACLDKGARAPDMSVIAYPGVLDKDGYDIAKSAEKGITTTTAQDAGTGAAAGAGVGLGVGVLAGLASIFIPGFGLVVGGGALATAIAGAAATAGAGAVAGGITGYLRDLGVEGDVPENFEKDYKGGKVIVGVAYHENGITPEDLSLLARKYHATRTTDNIPPVPPGMVAEAEVVSDTRIDETGEPVVRPRESVGAMSDTDRGTMGASDLDEEGLPVEDQKRYMS
jgi:hypothetical protein